MTAKTSRLPEWFSKLGPWMGAAGTFAILVLGGGFVWNEWINIPRLVYTILPTYDMGEMSFSGLIVENRGRTTSHQILVKVRDLEATIETLKIDSPEIVTQQEGGQSAKGVTLRLDRMAAGTSLTLYMLTESRASLEGHASITSEEGQAVLASEEGPTPGLFFWGLAAGVAIAYILVKRRIDQARQDIDRTTQNLERLIKYQQQILEEREFRG